MVSGACLEVSGRRGLPLRPFHPLCPFCPHPPLLHLRALQSFANSGVPRISRDSITGSDMPSPLGLVYC